MSERHGFERNRRIAGRLRQAADLLDEQGANPFRTRAYRQAAETVERLDRDIGEIDAAEGTAGLRKLPGIGASLAAAIAEMVHTGRWVQLDRLKGASDPEQLFQAVPGVGSGLARTIHERLDVDTLEALEIAAWDGRLEEVPGIGHRRALQIRAGLGEMLARLRPRRPPRDRRQEPEVGLLLDVDAEYRRRAEADELPRIAPRRFNPEGRAWLPVLHARRKGWHFTALYSNTARAHELDRVRDWVVVYFDSDGQEEGQRIIVTEQRGSLARKRVVRGREAETRAFYDAALEGRR
jgi:putative hydrolase